MDNSVFHVFQEVSDPSLLFFVENKMLFWVSNHMLLWERISMNFAVLINILVAVFYPFSGTVQGRVKLLTNGRGI